MSETKRDEPFIGAMLERMQRGDLPVRRQTPCAETKWTYHVGAKDPETGRVVVALGTARFGDDFSWGFEIDPAKEEEYLANDEEIATRAQPPEAPLAQRHVALVERMERITRDLKAIHQAAVDEDCELIEAITTALLSEPTP